MAANNTGLNYAHLYDENRVKNGKCGNCRYMDEVDSTCGHPKMNLKWKVVSCYQGCLLWEGREDG